jgi:two-component system, NarL family, sensor histidine kinase UhpB
LLTTTNPALRRRQHAALARLTLRARLIVLVGCVLFVSLLCGGVLAWWHAAQSARAEMQAALLSGEHRVRDSIEHLAEVTDREGDLRRLIATFDADRHVRASLLDASGRTVASSVLSTPLHPEPDWFFDLLGVAPTTALIPIGGMVSAARVIKLETDPHNEVGEAWTEFHDAMLIVLLFCVLSFALIYWTAGRSLRPLETLSAGFGTIGAGDYAARVAPGGPPEVERLARAFNAMAEHLGALEVRNQRLHTQLLTIQEEERADLARDLHDDVGPFLFAVNIDVASITTAAELRGDRETLERGRSIREAVSHMQKHVKSILGRLRQTGLSDIGLAQAVENLGLFWRRRHPQLAFHFDMGSPDVGFGDVIDATLYRLIQESVTNSIRHGRPRNVTVIIKSEPDGDIVLQVSDDGVGFAEASNETGLGLAGMQERIAALGGSLSVRNHVDGGGASVTARLPRETPADLGSEASL